MNEYLIKITFYSGMEHEEEVYAPDDRQAIARTLEEVNADMSFTEENIKRITVNRIK